MKNDAVIKYEINIFSKIKRFFISIFKRKDIKDDKNMYNTNKDSSAERNATSKNNFQQSVKFNIEEVNKEKKELEELINRINNDEDEISKLSVEEYKKVINYYENEINEIRAQIKKIKASN